ncbi:MAG: DUF3108 domain-containing protein [Akkermansiaceae bacterium]
MAMGSSSYAEQEWQGKIQPFTKGVHPEIRPVTLTYKMSWNGTINSGRATMVMGKPHKNSKKLFLMQAYGRSTGAAGALFPFSFVYNSFTKKGTYQPLVFISKETDHREVTEIKNIYRKSEVEHTRKDTRKSDGKVKERGHKFSQENLHDPLSGMLYIRGRALKNGDTVRLALHPFKSAQYAEVKVLGREQHLGYPCIKLDLKIKNIDRKTQQLKAYDKLKKATLWISDDKDRILIELRSKVFIGDVRMVLTGRSR